MDEELKEFCKSFNLVNNAISMRTLMRWNGRDVRNRENLSEHTHLVVACAIELYDKFVKQNENFSKICDFEKLIKFCMLHDSLELLTGDILSITKDNIPGLRDVTDTYESSFIKNQIGIVNAVVKDVSKLADLMACYKFIENELRFPSNDYMMYAYNDTKNKYDIAYLKFCKQLNFNIENEDRILKNVFVKGYEDDAGVDVLLSSDVTFLPMSTTSFSLKINVTPKEREMSFLCARTSAASKGLIVAMCPIDPNFTGEVTAIVHNVSNQVISYKKGESFCQVVTVPIYEIPNIKVDVKKDGKRSDGKLGSTGR